MKCKNVDENSRVYKSNTLKNIILHILQCQCSSQHQKNNHIDNNTKLYSYTCSLSCHMFWLSKYTNWNQKLLFAIVYLKKTLIFSINHYFIYILLSHFTTLIILKRTILHIHSLISQICNKNHKKINNYRQMHSYITK